MVVVWKVGHVPDESGERPGVFMGMALCGVFLQKSDISLVSKSRPGTFPRHAESLPSQGDRMTLPLIWDSGDVSTMRNAVFPSRLLSLWGKIR